MHEFVFVFAPSLSHSNCAVMSDSVPGPTNLNAVIEAAQAVTNEHRPVPPPKKKGRQNNNFLQQATTTNTSTTPLAHVQEKPVDPRSVNAVVRLMELAEPKGFKWQCRICTYIQTTTASMYENAKCECCLLPTVSSAPVTAVISPDVLRTAMSIRESVSNVLQQQHVGTSAATPVSTTSIPSPQLSNLDLSSMRSIPRPVCTPTSEIQQPRQRPNPCPAVWPRDERCCICDSTGVERYCSSCKYQFHTLTPRPCIALAILVHQQSNHNVHSDINRHVHVYVLGCSYLCNSRACMAALHDKASYEMYGCTPQDVYNMSTGRYTPGASSLVRDQTGDKCLSSASQPIEIDADDSGDINIEMDDIDVQSWNDGCNNQTSSCLFVKVVDVAVQTDDIDFTFSINNKVHPDN